MGRHAASPSLFRWLRRRGAGRVRAPEEVRRVPENGAAQPAGHRAGVPPHGRAARPEQTAPLEVMAPPWRRVPVLVPAPAPDPEPTAAAPPELGTRLRRRAQSGPAHLLRDPPPVPVLRLVAAEGRLRPETELIDVRLCYPDGGVVPVQVVHEGRAGQHRRYIADVPPGTRAVTGMTIRAGTADAVPVALDEPTPSDWFHGGAPGA